NAVTHIGWCNHELTGAAGHRPPEFGKPIARHDVLNRVARGVDREREFGTGGKPTDISVLRMLNGDERNGCLYPPRVNVAEGDRLTPVPEAFHAAKCSDLEAPSRPIRRASAFATNNLPRGRGLATSRP